MTTNNQRKKTNNVPDLKVIQLDAIKFLVESEKGKTYYKVVISDEELACTCENFTRGVKAEKAFRCKHINEVLSHNVNDIKQAGYLEKAKPKHDQRFIKSIEGKEYVLYAGLLDLAHQKGLKSIEVEPLQFPNQENQYYAVCKATVISTDNMTFIDVGDADKSNCNSRVSKHLLRMASTRSIARALRSYTNSSWTCLEELDSVDIGENESAIQSNQNSRKTPTNGSKEKKDERKSSPARKEESKQATSPSSTKPKPKKEEKPYPEPKPDKKKPNGDPKMSEAQKRATLNLSRRRGIPVEELEKMCEENYQTSLENLSSSSASALIRMLQTAA